MINLLNLNKYFYTLIVALHLQLSIFLGLVFSTLVGIFYLVINDSRYKSENIIPTTVGSILSLLLFLIGHYLHKKKIFQKYNRLNFKQSVLIVVLAWLIASLISSVVFILAGFPNSPIGESFSFLRVFTDAFFESMSGLTTTGSSILLDIESLPRSVLMWRTTSHWIGGMGLVYMTITIINNFKYSRFNLINAEVESPEATEFKDEFEARNSGFDFIKVYSFLTILMIVLLIISGSLFRTLPYEHWYDNVYDAVNHSFSTLGTGGFSHYSTSVGLPTSTENGTLIIGGLQNPVSEWIITIFMFISGANFGIWFLLIFKKDIKSLLKNQEMKIYGLVSFTITLGIALILFRDHYYGSVEQLLRYSSFAVGSVISTTGLANADFSVWPIEAVALLFIVYFVGGTVGSTGGGLKVKRLIAFFKNAKNEVSNFSNNKDEFQPVKIDTSVFSRRDMSLININIAFYLILFVLGGILIMIFDRNLVDFSTAMNASIANLGNIGPADFYGKINEGPTGGYAGLGIASKWVLIILMLFGRIGVLNIFYLGANFIYKKGNNNLG